MKRRRMALEVSPLEGRTLLSSVVSLKGSMAGTVRADLFTGTVGVNGAGRFQGLGPAKITGRMEVGETEDPSGGNLLFRFRKSSFVVHIDAGTDTEPTQLGKFRYTINSGTGRFAGATGSGILHASGKMTSLVNLSGVFRGRFLPSS